MAHRSIASWKLPIQSFLCALSSGILLSSCSMMSSDFDSKATLVVQVRDIETNLEIDGIQVDLLVDGATYSRNDERYSLYADRQGRIQFSGLPKQTFTIEVPETDARARYDTTFYEGSWVASGFNELVINLERKKTIFVGTVLDDEDNRPIEGAQLALSPGDYFAQTNSQGQFQLKASKINKMLKYTVTISKLPGYYSTSIDIPDPKLNSKNDLRSIMLRRTPSWVPPVVNEGEINIEKKRGPGRTRIG